MQKNHGITLKILYKMLQEKYVGHIEENIMRNKHRGGKEK